MVIPLVAFPLFDLLPDNEREVEFQKLKMLRFGAGEVIYERHGETMDVFFIFEGRIRIDSSAMRGNSAFFHYRRPGDMVGYYAAVTGKPQPVTATAAGAAWLGRMAAADFMEMVLSRRPCSAYMLRLVTGMLRAETDRLQRLILFNAAARVAAELLESLEETGSHVFCIENREEFAARLGMTRETLARQLSGLQRRGIIAIDRHDIRILDAAQLSEIAE